MDSQTLKNHLCIKGVFPNGECFDIISHELLKVLYEKYPTDVKAHSIVSKIQDIVGINNKYYLAIIGQSLSMTEKNIGHNSYQREKKMQNIGACIMASLGDLKTQYLQNQLSNDLKYTERKIIQNHKILCQKYFDEIGIDPELEKLLGETDVSFYIPYSDEFQEIIEQINFDAKFYIPYIEVLIACGCLNFVIISSLLNNFNIEELSPEDMKKKLLVIKKSLGLGDKKYLSLEDMKKIRNLFLENLEGEIE